MPRDIQPSRHRSVRYLLLSIGWLSVALGVIGIFLPVLPTTPFLLLAAACFVRSSRRFYLWLVTHPHLGPWIRDYLEGQGIPLKGKIYALVLMWASIAFPAIWCPCPGRAYSCSAVRCWSACTSSSRKPCPIPER